MLISLVVLSCGAPPPPPPPTPSLPRPAPVRTTAERAAEQQEAYNAAEAFRSRKAYPQALEAFAYFVQRYPPNALTDDALLMAGQLAVLLGETRRAQGYYQSLMANFPTSEHVPTAHLELGILLYTLKNYERGQAALQQYLQTAKDPARHAMAHYYLGLIAVAQQRYGEAVAALLRSAETSTDAEVAGQARAEIARLVGEQLTSAELEPLADQYQTTYPGDIILLQLARQYRQEGAESREAEMLQRFARHFGDHDQAQVVQGRLQELQGASEEPVKIGILLPLSGAGEFYGQRALQGIELAQAVLQERAAAVRLTLVTRDSQASREVATEALQTLAQDPRVVAVIGPLFSGEATAIAPLAEQLGLPLISPYAPEGQLPTQSTYAFRNSLTNALQGRFLADYAIRVLGLQRFAVLHTDDPYGVGLKEAFVEEVVRRRGEVVALANYAADATDFSEPIKRLGGADDETLQDLRAGADNAGTTGVPSGDGPMRPFDALFIPDFYDKVVLIAPTLALYNMPRVQLLGSDGWHSPELVALGRDAVEGAVFVDGFFSGSPSLVVRDFVGRFRARYGKEPDVLAAQAYDTLLLLAQVLGTDAAISRERVRDGLRRTRNFPGVSGTTSIGVAGEAEKIPYLLGVRGGRIVQLN